MSEGCWFFTLKMMKPASGNSDFPLKGFQQRILTGQKHKLSISRPIGQTLKKIRLLHFLELEKFEKIKKFWFSPQGRDIDDFRFQTLYLFEGNPFERKFRFQETGFTIFKVKNQHPSDIMRFLTLFPRGCRFPSLPGGGGI